MKKVIMLIVVGILVLSMSFTGFAGTNQKKSVTKQTTGWCTPKTAWFDQQGLNHQVDNL